MTGLTRRGCALSLADFVLAPVSDRAGLPLIARFGTGGATQSPSSALAALFLAQDSQYRPLTVLDAGSILTVRHRVRSAYSDLRRILAVLFAFLPTSSDAKTGGEE